LSEARLTRHAGEFFNDIRGRRILIRSCGSPVGISQTNWPRPPTLGSHEHSRWLGCSSAIFSALTKPPPEPACRQAFRELDKLAGPAGNFSFDVGAPNSFNDDSEGTPVQRNGSIASGRPFVDRQGAHSALSGSGRLGRRTRRRLPKSHGEGYGDTSFAMRPCMPRAATSCPA
jgi:hypothetical protein